MTDEIKSLLENIAYHDIFERYPLYFIGGTALSTYLEHRISYDIDIISTQKLPISAINALMFSLDAKPIIERTRASAFRINKGEDLSHYHLKFMVDGIKMEFSYFDDPIIDVVLKSSNAEAYSENSTLKKLSLDDIIKLKSIALFSRQKSRDLFDMAIILQEGKLHIDELERIYAFKKHGDKTLYEYIEQFQSKEDEEDTTLDFLPHHKYYKEFVKLRQDERFVRCKNMLLKELEQRKKEKLKERQRAVKSAIKKDKR